MPPTPDNLLLKSGQITRCLLKHHNLVSKEGRGGCFFFRPKTFSCCFTCQILNWKNSTFRFLKPVHYSRKWRGEHVKIEGIHPPNLSTRLETLRCLTNCINQRLEYDCLRKGSSTYITVAKLGFGLAIEELKWELGKPKIEELSGGKLHTS